MRAIQTSTRNTRSVWGIVLSKPSNSCLCGRFSHPLCVLVICCFFLLSSALDQDLACRLYRFAPGCSFIPPSTGKSCHLFQEVSAFNHLLGRFLRRSAQRRSTPGRVQSSRAPSSPCLPAAPISKGRLETSNQRSAYNFRREPLQELADGQKSLWK